MAIMADFARLPNQRKAMIFIVASFLIFLLYYQFVFKNLTRNLQDAEGQRLGKIAQTHQLDADIKKYNDLKPAVEQLHNQVRENEKALPTESELPAFFETLNRKVTESGVQVNRSNQAAEAPVESFIRVPVDFEITGTFMQIKRFFASLVPKKKKPGAVVELPTGDHQAAEERERIVSIDNLSIGDPQIRNREIYLTAKFTANTFRQEEKHDQVVAPGKKAVAPVPAPAPTGAGSAAKPLPSAATPAGAKVRANNAMDKSEQRSGSDAQRLKGGL